VATLTATADLPAPAADPQGQGTVTLPGIGEIRLSDGGVQYPVMGVKTSGWQEQNQLRVEVLDTEQQPYPDGLAVVFEHQPLGGSTLSDPLAAPSCAALPCVQSLATTDAEGRAAVRLYSGTVAGAVRVTASARTGAPPAVRQFDLPAVAIVGAKANAGYFSLVCGPVNVPALASTTCHVSLVDAPFTCLALVKDRYNNLLGRPTTVSFLSEAGSVGPPATTPAYDPAKDPSAQGDLGSGLGLVNTLGGKLPKDVAAGPGESSVTTPGDVCGITQHSPRDGVVAVVAWTPGEESFFDANGNGTYDVGIDPFIDLPEPFVDYDDDDTRDADEPFIDTDQDGGWDGPNGTWDAATNVWTKTVIAFTGTPAFQRSAGNDALIRWMEQADAGTYPAPTPIASFAVRPAFAAETFVDCNSNQLRDTAVLEPYQDANTNGSYDVGESFTDCNGNAARDPAPVAERFSDANGNGVYDPFATAATSETLVVSASDVNLNRLAKSATYAAAPITGAKFKVDYAGSAALPDRLGFGFAFRPCLASTPTTCAQSCAEITTPADTRCVMRSRVADFSYGYTAPVTITGGEVGSSDGPTSAFWYVTLFGETLSVPVSGTHQ
jgi:hypothetical protein